jgi:protein TorT
MEDGNMERGRAIRRLALGLMAVAATAAAVGCGSSSSDGGGSGGSDGGATATTKAASTPGWKVNAEFIDCKASSSTPKGCDGTKVPGTYEALPGGSTSEPWRVCVSLPHLKDAYWVAVDYGAAEEAKRLGIKADILDAGGYTNLPKQISQLDNCVAQGASAVVIGGISYDGLDAKIEEFSSQGIPVVDIMNGLSSAKVGAHALVNFYDMGHAVGQYLADQDKALKVAWLPGPPGAGWVDSANKGFNDALKGSQVQIVATKYGDTGKEIQLPLVENVLQTYPDVDYIVGTAVTAEAATTALQERGLEKKIKLLADYMIPTTYDLIKKGSVACAPTDSPVVQAKMGVDMAVRLLEKQPLVDDKGRAGPKIELICGPGSDSKDNVSSFVPDTTFAPTGFKPVASAG